MRVVYRFLAGILMGLVFLSCTTAVGQSIHWADAVLDFSSQKSAKLFSAEQLLHQPNKYPNPTYSTCAWSPEFSDMRTTEFIRVAFTKPLVAKTICIVENHAAGNIKRIFLHEVNKKDIQVYSATAPENITGGRMFSLDVSTNTAMVDAVYIEFFKAPQNNTYQIDAIGISDVIKPTLPIINISDIGFPGVAERLPDGVNSEVDDVYPIVSPDGKTLYFDRKLHPENTGDQHHDDIWMSTFVNGTWTPAKNIGTPLNNDQHNFLCSISPDGTMAMVGNAYSGENTGGVSFTNKNGNTWSTPKSIHIEAFTNVNPYNEFTLSAGGNILLMSIETPAGNGLLDIYVSFKNASGDFTAPKHLGNTINSAGNEMTPFLAADGFTLYFSSNGFPGYGNQDIYMSKRLDESWTNWSTPVNLGSEVNTEEWDVYFSTDARGEFGYYASSKSALTNLDIFRIPMPPTLQPENVMWLKGKITNKVTGQPIVTGISYELVDKPNTHAVSSSNAEGNYAVILPERGHYRLILSANGYLRMDTLINLEMLNDDLEAVRNFTLVPLEKGVIVQMRNILFKVNSDALEDTSFAELDRIAQFLQLNPGVSVEIRGHTNGVCGEAYCNQLSTQRAKTVMEYLIKQGVPSDRLTYAGYGKTLPIASNSTPEGRQANQRVEFMITDIR